ncbi:hypothetical protein REPUB_Repub11eG0049400 [Reevesia pubescens]
MVEAMAALKALEFSADMGFTKIVLEGDALSIITKLKEQSSDYSLIRPIIEDAKLKSKGFVECSFSHVPKSGNAVAHELGKFGLGRDTDVYWVEETPVFLEYLVAKDASVLNE